MVVRSTARPHPRAGARAAMPGLDHTTIVVTTPIRVEPLIARGETSDAVPVVVSASGRRASRQILRSPWSPGLRIRLQGSAERLERAIRHGIGDSTFESLERAGCRRTAERVAIVAEETLRGIGVSLTRLDIEAVESRVTRQLMSWADQQSRSACGPRR